MKRVIYFLALFNLFVSCEEQNDHLGPYAIGDVLGWLNLNGEFGTEEILEDHSGIKVTFKGFDEKSTTTDSDGFFRINNLRSGTYKITYSKEGFSLYEDNYNHLGGQKYYIRSSDDAIDLYKIPSGTCQLSAVEDSFGYVTFDYSYEFPETVANTSGYKYFIVFYGTDQKVSSENHDGFRYLYDDNMEGNTCYGDSRICFFEAYPSDTEIYFVLHFGELSCLSEPSNVVNLKLK